MKKEKTKYFPQTSRSLERGGVDAGLLFAGGFFSLTLALTIAYFSHFGLSPLSKSGKKVASIPAAAIVSSIPPSDNPFETQEVKITEFVSSLSDVPVKEIFIGSYGTIDKTILEKLKNKMENVFAVPVTILNPGPAVPKEAPFYDKIKDQYNGDLLLKSVEQSSSPYGKLTRFLYVVDVDITAFSGAISSPIWIRANKDSNAALLSIYNFHTEGTTSPQSKLLLDRVEKSALHAIGLTVGFGASPSVEDPSCIMHPVLTLEELDLQKNLFCSPESESLAQIFRK